MCGIAGVVNFKKKSLDKDIIPRIWNSLDLRGPDDKGYCAILHNSPSILSHSDWDEKLSTAKILFAHTRLSIIDLSAAGHQPFSSDDGKYVLTFNGEIYNYIELREELRSQGAQFKTSSDTEVLLQGYIHWGSALLDKLVGMYAFALYDGNKQIVLIARDNFGIKPLYYYHDQESFYFASTTKSLLCFSSIPREVSMDGIYNFLRYGITDYKSTTLFKHIKQLEPGHAITLDLKANQTTFSEVTYWQPNFNNTIDISFDHAKDKFRELFFKSIQLHTRSDVPFGITLSGGTDSGAILSTLEQIYSKNLDLHSFSYLALEPSLSEEECIRESLVGRNVKSHFCRPTGEDMRDDIHQLISEQGEPFTSSSVFALWSVCKLAHAHKMKILLEGQGADEILGGYSQYRASRLVSLINNKKIFEAIKFIYHCSAYNEGVGFLISKCIEHYLPNSILNSINENYFNYWYKDIFNLNAFKCSRIYSKQLGNSKNTLKEDLMHSLTTLTIPHLLRKSDRNHMAFSIENRVPFLEKNLVNFAYSLPEEYLISQNGTTKSIMRESLKDIMPQKIYASKIKKGFDTSERVWMVSVRPLIEKEFASKQTGDIPIFLKSLNLNRLYAHKSNKATNFIWRAFSLLLWIKAYDVKFNELDDVDTIQSV